MGIGFVLIVWALLLGAVAAGCSIALGLWSWVDAALNEMKPRPMLQSAEEFYNDRRWGRADVVAAALIALPAIALTIGWYFWFIRARRDGVIT